MDNVFDRDFCLFLEYRLCKLLAHSDDLDANRYWCDGVMLETVLNNHACFTTLIGKIGKAANTEYNLYLRFGEISSKLYAEGASLQSSVPDVEQIHLFSFDITNKRIHLGLN